MSLIHDAGCARWRMRKADGVAEFVGCDFCASEVIFWIQCALIKLIAGITICARRAWAPRCCAPPSCVAVDIEYVNVHRVRYAWPWCDIDIGRCIRPIGRTLPHIAVVAVCAAIAKIKCKSTASGPLATQQSCFCAADRGEYNHKH